MTNREKYKRAFSAIETSDSFSLEVEKMAINKKKHAFRTAAAAIAVCILAAGGSGAAYAADLGGIQRTIQLWIHGDQTDATIHFSTDGTYEVEYTDSEGQSEKWSGGGVAIDADGTERPATEEELMEEINAPDVVYSEDGTVTIYYRDQKMDITDLFEDGVCYVKLEGDGEVLYVTVKYKNGLSYSHNKYISPNAFN